MRYLTESNLEEIMDLAARLSFHSDEDVIKLSVDAALMVSEIRDLVETIEDIASVRADFRVRESGVEL